MSNAHKASKTDRDQYLKRYQKLYRVRHKRLELVLTPEEHKTLKAAAKHHNKKLSTFTKEAALAYLNQDFLIPDEDQVQSVELALLRIGVNVNQLVRHVHRDGLEQETLRQIQALIEELEARVTETLRHPEKRNPEG